MSKSKTLPQIRRLVDGCGLTYTEVAALAKVRYPNLRRFMLGHTENLNFVEAEKVFFALTGQPLTPPRTPLKPELRKGRAAA